MLFGVQELTKYRIRASDGEIGKVHDILFDDCSFVVRYLVADVHRWLPGRQVLISPQALLEPDWHNRLFPVDLTRRQVQDGPVVTEDEPVSAQKAKRIHDYFRWLPPRWIKFPDPSSPKELEDYPPAGRKEGDPHLRSCREMVGYRAQAGAERIGQVEDFLVEGENWEIEYLVVDTRRWLPGHRVMIEIAWLAEVDWNQSLVRIDRSADEIRECTPYRREEASEPQLGQRS